MAQQVAQRMVMNSSYRYKSTRIGYSGLLNPLMLGYSSRDGLTYRQKLSFTIDLKRSRNIKMDAFAGYMFQHKELFTDLTTTFNYEPLKLGSATLSIGNGNPTYSSLFVDQVRERVKKYGLSFNDFSLNYYKDFYFTLFNTFEPANGLLLQTGFDYHIRKSTNKRGDTSISIQDENIGQLFGTKRSLPFCSSELDYPNSYYRFEGRQKIYDRSAYHLQS